jgi:hypothetical protein
MGIILYTCATFTSGVRQKAKASRRRNRYAAGHEYVDVRDFKLSLATENRKFDIS